MLYQYACVSMRRCRSSFRLSGGSWLSNWQWRAVVRFANVCWGVGLGKEPWRARQTVKSWMWRVNTVCRAPFLLSVCPNKRASLSAMWPPIQCFCRRISKKKTFNKKNFCEIFAETTYWQQKSVLYIVRGWRIKKVTEKGGGVVCNKEKERDKKYENAAKRGWFLEQVKKKS